MRLEKRDLVIVEEYSFLGQQRYRVQVKGTNIVFNVEADNPEKALEKALELAQRIGLTKDIAETIRQRISSMHT